MRSVETRGPVISPVSMRTMVVMHAAPMARNPIIREPKREVPTDETPHGCWDGWVYLGFEGEDENGEHVEELERVPCRRCKPKSL